MIDYQALYNDFVSADKSLLIAPAGNGKTHSIALCLKVLKDKYNIENQLILTHTHAGVASLKDKINSVCPECKCKIETISSFAQKYVEAFFCGDLPEQDTKEYFPFLIKKATALFGQELIITIINNTYSGLFVDEYQDCTESQHKMVLNLSAFLKTRAVGDELQGIFSFNGESLVNFKDLYSDFILFRLDEPWRWVNSNPELGVWTNRLRLMIEKNTPINLSELDQIKDCHFFISNEDDLEIRGSACREILNKIIYNKTPYNNLGNTLLISETKIWQRVKLNQSFNYSFNLLEAFDDGDFYKYAKKLDEILISEAVYHDFITLLKGKKNGKSRSSTLITGLSQYFKGDSSIPNSRKEPLKTITQVLKELVLKPDKKNIAIIIKQLIQLPEIKVNRKELLNELLKAINLASTESISIYKAMKSQRNVKRNIGRKVNGRSIGTTLLTKGLEFETVIVLNVHKITNPKNLYVALTRSSKRLIVFSQNQYLSPHS